VSVPQPVQRVSALLILAALPALPLAALLWLGGPAGLAARAPDWQRAGERLRAAAAAGAALPGLRAELARLERQQADTAGLLPQPNAALAAAALQAEIRAAVRGAGGELRSVQGLPVAREAGLERIGLSLEISAPESALPGLLAALSRSDVFIRVVRLQIRRIAAGPGGQGLAIRCDLAGFRRAAAT
jgi:hypothetical protein